MANRLVSAVWCLFLCLVFIMSSGTDARRALTWPPKRDRETASWPASYSSNKPRVITVSSDEDDDTDEPSCDELRAIWRLSKRAARESLLSNKIPPAHTSPGGGPLFGYMVHTPQVLPKNLPMTVPMVDRSRPKQSFGRIIVDPARSRPMPTSGFGNGYDQVAKEMRNAGVFAEKPVRHVGSRPTYVKTAYPTAVAPPAPRPVAYGKNRAAYKNYVYTTAAQPQSPATANRYKSGSWGVYKNPVVYRANDPVVYNANRKPHLKSKHSVGKNYGHYLETSTGFSTDTSGCHDIDVKQCQMDEECACYGLYTCIRGRCRTTSLPGNHATTPKWRNGEIWHEGPLPSSELGVSTPATSSTYRRVNDNHHMKHWKPVASNNNNNNNYNTDRFGTWS